MGTHTGQGILITLLFGIPDDYSPDSDGYLGVWYHTINFMSMQGPEMFIVCVIHDLFTPQFAAMLQPTRDFAGFQCQPAS